MQKEPIDIAHIKGSQYLLGCFDGSLMLKDVSRPEKDLTFEQHLRNRATWIRSIIIDCDRKVWIGTSNGLTVYSRDFKIIRQLTPYDDKVKFFGHFRIMWTDSRRRFIFWWCDRGSIKVFDARTLKIVVKFRDMLRHPDERPNHYTFLDGSWRKVFFVTNHWANIGVYYVLDVCRRKVFGGEAILPKSSQNRLFAHICIAYNCPSDCIVTTGVSSLVAGDPQHMESKEEISHMSVFRLLPDNALQLVDFQLNSELKLMTIASVVFHTATHTRILSVLTKHVYIIDLVDGKLQVLFKIRDINKGECVHQLVRADDYFLFVGNYGQIFRIDFHRCFFEDAAARSGALLADSEDQSLQRQSSGSRAGRRAGWSLQEAADPFSRGLDSPDERLSSDASQRRLGPRGSEKTVLGWPGQSHARPPALHRPLLEDARQADAAAVSGFAQHFGGLPHPAPSPLGFRPAPFAAPGPQQLEPRRQLPRPQSDPTAWPDAPQPSDRRRGKRK